MLQCTLRLCIHFWIHMFWLRSQEPEKELEDFIYQRYRIYVILMRGKRLYLHDELRKLSEMRIVFELYTFRFGEMLL